MFMQTSSIFVCLHQSRPAGGVMFATWMVVRLSGRSFVTNLWNTIFWKRMNQYCCKLAQVVHGAAGWNVQRLGWGGSKVKVRRRRS